MNRLDITEKIIAAKVSSGISWAGRLQPILTEEKR